jgi:transcriptional regulator with XRE-family HTH domain
VVLDKLEILLGPDQRTRVAGKRDDRQGPEDGVDSTPLEPELTEVGTVQERSRGIEKLLGRWMTASRGSRRCFPGRSGLRSGLRLPFNLEPELLRISPSRHRYDCNRYVTYARNAPDAYDACMTSGTLIRQARTRSGLSQAELSERSGKDRAQIARWERDVVTPSLETLRELLQACGFDLEMTLVLYQPPDPGDEAELQRALERTPQERLQAMLEARGG